MPQFLFLASLSCLCGNSILYGHNPPPRSKSLGRQWIRPLRFISSILEVMRILLAHNLYQQPGGEDVVVDREAALLKNAGHDVIEYRRSNAELHSFGLRQQLALPKRAIWASDTVRDLRKLIRDQKPDIAHFHNTFLMISPAAYYACRAAGVPTVQSLHNPRLMCPAATFFRDGRLCEDCLGKSLAWPGILHACYQDSRTKTAGSAAIVSTHRWLKTWDRRIDAYITFTEFYRQKFIEGGLPAEKVMVKPHFVCPDPGLRGDKQGDYALFVGRLHPEKGVRTLLRAWQQVEGLPLKIRGEGRLLGEVQNTIKQKNLDSVELIGRLSKECLIDLIRGARFLVWPSEGYYETFGLVAIEAFSCGVPVLASRTGVMAEVVENRRTGLHFTPGDPHDLAAQVEWALENPIELARMRRNARSEFEAKYTAEKNYCRLMEIYELAAMRAKARA
jgi:glycosyltransferase involved in cell wall biosynthesis